jgi:hypothetical protein
MKKLLQGLNASHKRMIAIACAAMLGACAPVASPLAKPQPEPTPAMDAVASRLGVAGSPDYHAARASLGRITAEWNDAVPPHLEDKARELMQHTATLDAMKRQPRPAGEWEELIARAKALAEESRR